MWSFVIDIACFFCGPGSVWFATAGALTLSGRRLIRTIASWTADLSDFGGYLARPTAEHQAAYQRLHTAVT
jgi:hypothetical protein